MNMQMISYTDTGRDTTDSQTNKQTDRYADRGKLTYNDTCIHRNRQEDE